MLAPWTDQYVGIPYRHGGRDRSGCDCWGLVRLVLDEQFGVVLPTLAGKYEPRTDEYARMVCETTPLIPTIRVVVPSLGDIALLTVRGTPCHVGIYVGGGYMLHTLFSHDSALDRAFGPRWSKATEGYYRVKF